MFQEWNLVQSSMVCEIVDDGDDDDMDGGGGFSSYDEPFVDYPDDEVEVPNLFKKYTDWCLKNNCYNNLV
jgi:hypothetical protein